MKKTLRNTLVLALTVLASTVYATDINTHIAKRGDDKVSVHYNAHSFFKVKIKNKYGEIIHTEKSRNGMYVQTFSFEDVVDGKYIIETTNSNSISSVVITVKNGKIELLNPSNS